MDLVHAHPGRSCRPLVALLVALLASTALALVGPVAGAASKTATQVKNGEMTWAFSNYVLTPNPATLSVSEVHDAEAPATFTDGSGWTFTDGSGTYDRKTGALSVDFPGAIEFGNTSRGNYAFKLASPSIELDDEGVGTLTAEFSVRPAGATAYDAASRLVVLDIVGAESTRTKKTVEVTAAPTEFSSELVAAAADLAAHFQATGSANDANKPPAPITLTFDYKVKKK